MSKIKKILLVFVMIILLSGCNSKNDSKEGTEEVTDNSVTNYIKSQITALESLPKTITVYTKGEGTDSDYDNEDKIRYGLEARISNASVPMLTADEIQQLAQRNIIGVSSYIETSEVASYVSKNFESSTLDYITLSGCPTFTYDAESKKYYIQTECVIEDPTSIYSYVDKVTKKDNVYYATVYAGLSDGSMVYNDFEKTKVVANLTENQSYTISDTDKTQFTKFTYKFEKNTNGDYIFKSITKEK